jgi:glucose-fructose oxidoreductase
MNTQNKTALSRREALVTIGLGAGALAMSTFPQPVSAQAAGLQTTRKLGIALVGLGNYSTLQLAPALQETALCRLAGIVTGSADKAKAWSEKYAIPQQNIYNYDNFDKIKDNPI